MKNRVFRFELFSVHLPLCYVDLTKNNLYEGISRRLCFRTSVSELMEDLETLEDVEVVEADLELLYDVRRES